MSGALIDHTKREYGRQGKGNRVGSWMEAAGKDIFRQKEAAQPRIT